MTGAGRARRRANAFLACVYALMGAVRRVAPAQSTVALHRMLDAGKRER